MRSKLDEKERSDVLRAKPRKRKLHEAFDDDVLDLDIDGDTQMVNNTATRTTSVKRKRLNNTTRQCTVCYNI